jgi:hypothetical protein
VGEQLHATVGLPHARRHPAARTHDPAQLTGGRGGVGHEVEHQLGERHVETVVVEGEGLGSGLLHLPPETSSARCYAGTADACRLDQADFIEATAMAALGPIVPTPRPDVSGSTGRPLRSPSLATYAAIAC